MDGDHDTTELAGYMADIYSKLVGIWELYGFPVAIMDKRRTTVIKHTKDLFDEMLTEEEKRLTEKQKELTGYRQAIAKLCRDLEQDVPPLIATTLIQQCEESLSLEAKLKGEKAEKMKEWIMWKKGEKELRELLGEAFVGDVTDFDGIPGKKDLEALKKTVGNLEGEKMQRETELKNMKPRVLEMLKNLEKSELNEIEKKIIDGPLDILPEFLTKCREVEAALAAQVESNRVETERLRIEIEDLLQRLKEAPEASGQSLPDGYAPSILVKVRAEHVRLTQLKLANISKFIERLRVDIEQLSEVVFKKPLLPEVMEPTEQSLDLHERVMESLKSYQAEHKKLLEMWRKRQTLWSQWLEYEAKADDPTRFNNRGGALLKEEKQRKVLEKNLPKLEAEITVLAETCPAFKIMDKDVKEIIAEDWQTFNHDKEEKKLAKKQQAGTNSTAAMNVTRKRPMTPSLGTGNNTGTPAGKRGKMIPVTTPGKSAGTISKRTLRSSTSKDNLVPSPTYSEFASHKHILQSTMNEPKGSAAKPPKSPGPTPRGGKGLSAPKMTPREIQDKF